MQVCNIWHYLRYLRKVIPGPSQKNLEKSPRNGTTRPWPHGCHNRVSSGRGVSEKNAGKATQVTVRDLEHINENLIHFMENRTKTVIKDITGLATFGKKVYRRVERKSPQISPDCGQKEMNYSAPGNWETIFFVCACEIADGYARNDGVFIFWHSGPKYLRWKGAPKESSFENSCSNGSENGVYPPIIAI